ncbi:hypothetical protein ACLOJK_024992 [Asimina triloba]
MAFSTGLRFTASSLLIRYHQRLPSPSILHLKPCLLLPDLRFVSSVGGIRGGGTGGIVRKAKKGGGDADVNGSLAVKEKRDEDAERVVEVEIGKEMTEAYMAYSMSVLLGRALPDVRDGMKPVHRRILFAMHELGLSSRKPFRKCARVVGEVLGKFHPHGDSAVYDALVRMAQDFSLRCPLIRGHGNFGSIDADPPAAMRYTECRLDALTEAMLLADLEQNTASSSILSVDFVPNFDGSQKEPSLLPARLPTLLLNGSSGIAVGMATNIPPHNLGELVDALSVLIHNPEATLQELLEYVPGPDFPTGGLIMGNVGILEAYRTGRGRIIIRGKTDVELLDAKTKCSAIVIKEVPYQTNKSALVKKIAELVENKSLEGISDIRDESDRSGMRIVIELKRGSDPSIVLNNLFHHTALQSSFSCNMVGSSVVERRAKFRLSQAQERKHIVEGIIIGLDNVDGVIRLVKENSTNAMATAALMMGYGLSERQAEAIMDITLRKLTSLEVGFVSNEPASTAIKMLSYCVILQRKKFIDEDKSLTEQISNLNELLSNKKNILQLIEQESIELKKKFSTPRRSVLEDGDGSQLEEIDVIPNEEMLLVLSEKGYAKRMKPSTINLQHRGTIGRSVGKMRVSDAMSDFIVCQAHDHVLYFSDRGIVYSARAFKIPECTRTATGTPLVQVPGDELKWVRRCTNDDLIAMASQSGRVILSPCSKANMHDVRALGRSTRGSIAMRLKGEDKMASMDIIPASMQRDLQRISESPKSQNPASAPWLLFVSESGHGKRVPLSSFRESSLNRVGLIGYKLPSDVRLAAVFVVGYSLEEDGESDEQLVLVSQSGTINRIKVQDISIQSRRARGVILMRLEYTGKIQSASLISATAEDVESTV